MKRLRYYLALIHAQVKVTNKFILTGEVWEVHKSPPQKGRHYLVQIRRKTYE